MPPRKRATRASKKAEASLEEPAAESTTTTQPDADEVSETVEETSPKPKATRTSKRKAVAKAAEPDEAETGVEPEAPEVAEPEPEATVMEPAEELAVAPVAEEPVQESAEEEKKTTDKEPVEKPTIPSAPEPTKDTSLSALSPPSVPPVAPATSAADRMARFKALQARAKSSTDQNLKAAVAETQRLSTDASQLNSLRRKMAVASHKILKSEVEDAGGDFERKRAWDWTAEESERWDKRMKKKAAHRDNAAFQDYTQEAGKVYKKQIRSAAALSAPDLEQYARDKLAAVEKAAAAGTLEIVETADGELIAVDKDGTFFSTAESTSFADNRPSKEAIDRLVNDQKKADEASLRKRRERMAKNGEDADVTYINEKNKHFNQKLARFYNKYTTEIRESFERGTMI
ncbi:Pre-mRNA-splicing factor SYF2 [Sporothrix bragantina]|uniref:Pre-mRNA-splicing factor SYF2 n=1 Tax=Sporothrix bragantina TaxID=671064 RepID=A0ABP0C4Q5_9PEZI